MEESEEDEEADEAAMAADEPEEIKKEAWGGAPDDKLRLFMSDIRCATSDTQLGCWIVGVLAMDEFTLCAWFLLWIGLALLMQPIVPPLASVHCGGLI